MVLLFLYYRPRAAEGPSLFQGNTTHSISGFTSPLQGWRHRLACFTQSAHHSNKHMCPFRAKVSQGQLREAGGERTANAANLRPQGILPSSRLWGSGCHSQLPQKSFCLPCTLSSLPWLYPELGAHPSLGYQWESAPHPCSLSPGVDAFLGSEAPAGTE